MSIKDKILPETDANLHVSFDVGHSSIGWAVLEKTGQQVSDIKINGCGSVVFRADDCLASSRRAYRRHPFLESRQSKNRRREVAAGKTKWILFYEKTEKKIAATSRRRF